jgi:xanthine dehydrogenase small subunit
VKVSQKISFILNGNSVSAKIESQTSALETLRRHFGLNGSHEGCNEGDCGACTIGIASPDDRTKFYAIASCIYPAFKLNGKIVVTIEGLADGGELHPIQRAILENYATQCGFCTPGIIMSLFCLFSRYPKPTSAQIDSALEGNLCRCTGYVSIKKAADELAAQDFIDVPSRLNGNNSLSSSTAETDSRLIPTTREQLVGLMSNSSDFKLICGATDIFVEQNILHKKYDSYLDISNVREFEQIVATSDAIVIGAACTLTRIAESDAVANHVPVLPQTILKMASQQIRNVATLVGNIANMSPIADGAVIALCLGAQLNLLSPQGTHKIPLENFYTGYKTNSLKKNELIESVEIPFQRGKCSFIKSSKRKYVDIASVNSAMRVEIVNETITDAFVVFGGVAVIPKIASDASKYLIGKRFVRETFEQAGEIAQGEFTPISDVRGGAGFRKELIKNHFLSHFFHLSK